MFLVSVELATPRKGPQNNLVGALPPLSPSLCGRKQLGDLPVTAAFFLSLLFASSMSIDLTSQNQPLHPIEATQSRGFLVCCADDLWLTRSCIG